MIKQLVKRGFASRWGWRLAGPILRRPGVIVLTYHRINGVTRDSGRDTLAGMAVEKFAAQMRWVRDHCHPIHPDEIRDHVTHRRMKPPVLVTFDDGFRDYHDLAHPILKELRIPALVFVATSFMDEGGLLWTETVQWAALSTKKSRVTLPWSGEQVPLPDARARDALGEKARAWLKAVPDGERRAAVDAFVAETGAPPDRGREMLSWDEVRATLDVTTYGGHSHTHPIMSRLDRAACEREVRTCRDRIAAETGVTPRYFAYPNGRPADYTAETQAVLHDHGFDIAYTSSEGIAGAGTDWMAVKRLPSEAPQLADFAWLAAGLMRS
jgi:peptidoglycan/xylan/chitin deacetylase (PgdA/CDA1 family)